jgi:hypothetical protein
MEIFLAILMHSRLEYVYVNNAEIVDKMINS